MSTVNSAPPRPNNTSNAVEKAAAQRFLPFLREWLNEVEEEFTDEELIADIIRAAGRSHGDAFHMAKAFDDMGYNGDYELCELCVSWDSFQHEETTKAVKQWVIDNNILPEFEVGDQIVYFQNGTYGAQKQGQGPIAEIRREIAVYMVPTSPTSSRYVPYEQALQLTDPIV